MHLHYRTYGAGPPLIILHGLFGSSTNWQGISKQLAQTFLVVAVDLRNHGRSPHTDTSDYPSMAADVLELMDALSLSSSHLLGHSMGGKAAMQLALSNPGRVERLVVVDIAPKAYVPRHDAIFAALRSLDLQAMRSRQEVNDALKAQIPSEAVRQFLLTNLAQDAAGALSWRINVEALYRSYPALNESLGAERSFDKPALFIRGEHSDYVEPSDEPLIKLLFPRATIRTVAGAGHWVHAEAPVAFTELVSEFLLNPCS